MTNQVNQKASILAFIESYGHTPDIRQNVVMNFYDYDRGYQAATQASESEINSLKQRVEELEAEVASCHKQIELDDGYMLDFKCHINSLREALKSAWSYTHTNEKLMDNITSLLLSTPRQSLEENDNE